jgi:undecaprenyl-diphosphatase
VAGVACVLIAPLWHLAGMAVTRWAIMLYRKLLARPIDLGWLRR